MSDIIRGYWTCPYCDSANIDGLADFCPNCGRHKPMDTKYYMRMGSDGKPEKTDRLSKEDLAKAGISEYECDGEHKEWVCGYCDSLNNWADAFCWSCNSSRDEATKQYGMEDIPETDPVSPIIPGIIATAAECLKDELDQKILDSLNGSGDGPKRSYGMVSKSIMVDEGDLLGRNEQKKVCTRP